MMGRIRLTPSDTMGLALLGPNRSFVIYGHHGAKYWAGGWCGGQPTDMHKNWQTVKTLPLHVKAVASKHIILYEEQRLAENSKAQIVMVEIRFHKGRKWAGERASPY